VLAPSYNWLTEEADEQREEKIVEGCQVYALAAERAKRGTHDEYG
jgi:hypothetical protein